MRRQAAGQGLFEAMVLIACAASLLLGAYGLMASRQGVGRDPRGSSNSSGTASSARQGVLAERPPLAGAGGAGAAAAATRAGEGI